MDYRFRECCFARLGTIQPFHINKCPDNQREFLVQCCGFHHWYQLFLRRCWHSFTPTQQTVSVLTVAIQVCTCEYFGFFSCYWVSGRVVTEGQSVHRTLTDFIFPWFCPFLWCWQPWCLWLLYFSPHCCQCVSVWYPSIHLPCFHKNG